MIVYADTSALMKLVHEEQGTAALREWLSVRDPVLVSSALGAAELRRAAARLGPAQPAVADAVLRTVHLVAITDAVLELAGRVPPAALRTLDAIHLVTAVLVADLAAVLCYDSRLGDALRALGVPVVPPAAAGPAAAPPRQEDP